MIFVFGCKNKSANLPAHIISQDTMISILTDIHIMEALHIQESIKQKDSLNNLETYKQQLVEKYKLDLKRFDQSFEFYTSNPKLLDMLYSEVLIELSKKKAEAEN